MRKIRRICQNLSIILSLAAYGIYNNPYISVGIFLSGVFVFAFILGVVNALYRKHQLKA